MEKVDNFQMIAHDNSLKIIDVNFKFKIHLK